MQPYNRKFFDAKDLTIDLDRFTCGRSRLGETIVSADFFASSLLKTQIYTDAKHGIEIGGENSQVEYVVVTMDCFPGRFVRSGVPLDIGIETTENDIVFLFGPPHWSDRSNDEVIFFYEYRQEHVQLQIEFEDGKTLSHLTLTRNGILRNNERSVDDRATRSLLLNEIRDHKLQWIMPIGLHVLLDTVILFAGVALWWVFILVLWPFDALGRIIHIEEVRGILLFAVFGLGFGMGMLLSNWFRRLPARCNKCGGKSFAEGNRPVRYVCRACRYTEITNINCSIGPK